MTKISIIVPVYNIYNYLERALESLVRQTYKNLEIILVDDGSTDGSSELCDQYKKKDSRIKVIHQKNGGVSVARNVGVMQATGEYIGFVDSDDVIRLDMYEVLYKNLRETDADISVCNYQIFRDGVLNFNKANGQVKTYTANEALVDLISDGEITSFLWNKLFKKELFKGITFPVGKIYEDMYVLPRVFEKAKKVCYTRDQLYGYYQRANSYVNTYSIVKNDNYLDFVDEIYQYLLKYQELQDKLIVYRCFSIYSAFLQAAKSRCFEIIKSKRMQEELTFFRRKFSISSEMTIKRRILYYLLYINKRLFYMVVILIR